jgi:hypothetical protein
MGSPSPQTKSSCQHREREKQLLTSSSQIQTTTSKPKILGIQNEENNHNNSMWNKTKNNPGKLL